MNLINIYVLNDTHTYTFVTGMYLCHFQFMLACKNCNLDNIMGVISS